MARLPIWHRPCYEEGVSRFTRPAPRPMLPLALAALVALLLPARPAAVQASDEQIGQRAAAAVRSYSRFTIFDDVTIHVRDRAVTLTGRVTIPLKKAEIGKRVGNVDGIRSLTNDIGVLPASPTDDRLRRAVASAIYNHPAFWRYAESAHPSIHIIIEHARVTLTGEVDSQGDRILAQSLALVHGVLGVENRLRVTGR